MYGNEVMLKLLINQHYCRYHKTIKITINFLLTFVKNPAKFNVCTSFLIKNFKIFNNFLIKLLLKQLT